MRRSPLPVPTPAPLVVAPLVVALLVVALLVAAAPLGAQTPLYESLGNATRDEYGAALADADDVDLDGIADLLAGAPAGADGGYMRVLSGDGESQIWRIPAPFGAQRFGHALTGIGDADLDGVPDFAVGAPDGGPGDGRVILFSGGTGAPILSIVSPASPANPWPAMGFSLATVGDLDGDGVIEFLAGAPALGGGSPGEVLVLTHDPPLVLYATLFGVDPGDQFGFDVADAGDVDGDGVHDILVGTGAGGYARVHSGATLVLLHHFTGPGEGYGRVVSGLGDVDGDGFDDVAVGSPGLDFVDVFSGDTGALLRRFDALSGAFGSAIAPLGDLDGDGTPDLAVGSPDDAPLGVEGAGSTVILSGATGGQLFMFIGSVEGARVGGALAALGDATADGERELAVGATGEGGFALPASGRVAVYSGALAGLILPYGFGCPDSFLITPVLELIGDPTGGGVVTLSITRGFPGSTAVVFIGTGQGLLPLSNGCILWVDPLLAPVLLLPLGGVFPGTGSALVTGVLPPILPPGTVLAFQAFEAVLDTPGDFASTGAVQLTTY
jgi:hypothetical protein